MSLLLIGIGIYTIASGKILIETAGIIMMISASIEIVGYIINKVLDKDDSDNIIYEEKVEITRFITNNNEKEETTEEQKLITKNKDKNEEIKTEKVNNKKRRKRKTNIKDIEAE